MTQSINQFDELTQFANNLNPEIKSKIKLRTKTDYFNEGYNYEKRFSEMFGKKSVDKYSSKNTSGSFMNTLLNSKLIVVTYPQTAFSEAMYTNIPTILLIKKDLWQFSRTALQILNVLKENRMAFEDFYEAATHINKNWKELDLWWKSENVQFARKRFLENFFNVKSNWYREWSDYIYFLSSSQ